LVERIRINLQLGKHEAAVHDCDVLLVNYPEEHEALYPHGLARRVLGDLEDSLADFDKYVRHIQGTNPAQESAVLLSRARTHRLMGYRTLCLADLERAIKLTTNIDALHEHAEQLADDGDFDDAIRDLTRAYEADPTSSKTVMQLASMHWQAGHGDDALRLLNRALDDSPDSLSIRAQRAAYRLVQHDHEGAIEDASLVLEEEVTHKPARITRAWAHVALWELGAAEAD
jgi:tetratricopeptide (TPR) repeat protein